MNRYIFLAGTQLFLNVLFSHAQQADEKDVEEKFQVLVEKYDSLKETDPIKALELAVEMEKLSSNLAVSEYKAKSLLHLGSSNFKIGNNKTAYQNLADALEIYEQLNDNEGMCLCYKQLGSVHNADNKNDDAFRCYKKALEIAQNYKIVSEISKIENNIAIIFLEKGHYDQAIQYFEQSAENTANLKEKAITIANIGVAYKSAGNLEKALLYCQKSLKYCHELDDERCTQNALVILANIYLEQEEYDTALKYTLQITEYEEGLGLKAKLLATYNRMGLIYDAKGDLFKADQYFKKSIKIADSLESRHLPYIYANLAKAFENAGQYKTALKYMGVFHQKKDSLINIDKEMQLEKLLTEYETEKKEQEIKLLKKESELQAALLANHQIEIKREQIIRNTSIAGAVLILSALAIAFWIYRQKVNGRELLALKTEELNKQKTLELLQEYELKAIKAFVEGQEKEKKRIAMDLHDGVAGTLAAIKMRIQKQIEENKIGSLKKLLPEIDNVYNEVRTLSHHLTPYNVVRGSYIDFLKNYVQEMEAAAQFEINFIWHGEDLVHLLTDEIKVELYRVIQEALSNASKYSEARNVDIQLVISEEVVNLIVEDDGKGFQLSESSPGIGLGNMKNRVQKLKGTLNIDSYPDRGTIVNVDIPLITKIQTLQEV